MRKKLDLKLKLTLSIAIMFLSMVVILTTASLQSLNKYFIAPVQSAIPTVPLQPTIDVSDALEIVPAENVMQALSGIVEYGKVQFNTMTFLAMGIVGIVGIAITYIIVSRSLKPLDTLTSEIGKIDENAIHQPLEVDTTSKEVEQLTISFNKMLKRLESVFNVQKRFSTAAAHELKTPLAVLKTNIEVLDEQATLEEYKHVMEVTKRQVERMNDLVNNLLLVSTSSEYNCNEVCSIQELVKNALSELNPRIKEKAIQVRVSDTDCTLIGNEVMLQRAISNLLDNSIKYAKRIDPRITIEIRQDQEYLSLMISDNGIGIPEDQLNLITEPFYRIDQSRSRKIAGSGLGLTLVKEIIERHHGHLNIESKLDEGTTISIQLPLKLSI
ncbi:sensor histidine kinase [Anaerorhabdus sp.]|uniref:sensor histidine kinase n=1 Tax=Anaerorhabdus sp. TaxID=1872524 RepID=UPI002FCB7BCF